MLKWLAMMLTALFGLLPMKAPPAPPTPAFIVGPAPTIISTTTTTEAPITIPTTTTNPVASGTITTPMITIGPPRNTTTLVGCIAYYESTWGKDPNVFQFTDGTWKAYGGKGSPSVAPYWRQLEVFWLAWEDAGPSHWAAQKGRCF